MEYDDYPHRKRYHLNLNLQGKNLSSSSLFLLNQSSTVVNPSPVPLHISELTELQFSRIFRLHLDRVRAAHQLVLMHLQKNNRSLGPWLKVGTLVSCSLKSVPLTDT